MRLNYAPSQSLNINKYYRMVILTVLSCMWIFIDYYYALTVEVVSVSYFEKYRCQAKR